MRHLFSDKKLSQRIFSINIFAVKLIQPTFSRYGIQQCFIADDVMLDRLAGLHLRVGLHSFPLFMSTVLLVSTPLSLKLLS